MILKLYHWFPLGNIDGYKFSCSLECTSFFMQVFTASSHLDAVCLGVQGIAGPLPEKNQELDDQSKCDSY